MLDLFDFDGDRVCLVHAFFLLIVVGVHVVNLAWFFLKEHRMVKEGPFLLHLRHVNQAQAAISRLELQLVEDGQQLLSTGAVHPSEGPRRAVRLSCRHVLEQV